MEEISVVGLVDKGRGSRSDKDVGKGTELVLGTGLCSVLAGLIRLSVVLSRLVQLFSVPPRLFSVLGGRVDRSFWGGKRGDSVCVVTSPKGVASPKRVDCELSRESV